MIEHFAWEPTSADGRHLSSTTRRYRFGGDGNGGFSRTKLVHFSAHSPSSFYIIYVYVCIWPVSNDAKTVNVSGKHGGDGGG